MEWATLGVTNFLLLVLVASLFGLGNQMKDLCNELNRFRIQWLEQADQKYNSLD